MYFGGNFEFTQTSKVIKVKTTPYEKHKITAFSFSLGAFTEPNQKQSFSALTSFSDNLIKKAVVLRNFLIFAGIGQNYQRV